MRGFAVAIGLILLTVAVTVLCALYADGVLTEAMEAVEAAEDGAALRDAARTLEKERLRLHLMIRETEVDGLIRRIDEAALYAEDGALLEAAKRDIAARLAAMKRDLLPNPM